MRCAFKRCEKEAVFDNPCFCGCHFTDYFEEKVESTIKKFKLVGKDTNAVVAVSGGKDSLVTAHLLSKHCHISLLAVDEGISGYREHTISDLKRFSKEFGPFDLKIVSFSKEFSLDLDSMLKKTESIPCSVCGTFRRFMLNKYAQGFDVIATGHNMDDEAQAILMNMVRGQSALLERIGPRTKEAEGFIPRVKPLYLCTEKEILAYAFLKGISVGFHECPYSNQSFRAAVRDALNDYEAEEPGSKKAIIDSFLSSKTQVNASIDAEGKNGKRKNGTSDKLKCKSCGFPSASSLTECSACQLKKSLQGSSRIS